MTEIDAERLLDRLRTLGEIGRGADGELTRLAGSDADRAARDQLVAWMQEAGLTVSIDAIGNVFGVSSCNGPPLMVGSHIDSVVNAGIFDGCFGVLAGLAVAEALGRVKPIVVAAFTNEEGVRYAPDMMGSLVHAGGLPLADALASVGTDGSVLGQELARIGYAGPMAPGTIRPSAYLELHVEQGPILAREGVAIGAVEALQGISWQRITIEGEANHAGTTPMRMRRDAGLAAARIMTFLHDHVARSNAPTVATVGSLRLEPDAINVIPARAILTVDLRDPDEQRLQAAEAALADFLATLPDVTASTERLARFRPVRFDAGLVAAIEAAAAARGLSCRRMVSGAGHDAQMMARICPAAMIFVPSTGGISHSPREHTADADLVAGANVLLDVVRGLL